jgi:hypothetical protein
LPDRTSSEISLNYTKDIPIKFIKRKPVDPLHGKSCVRDILRDLSISPDKYFFLK